VDTGGVVVILGMLAAAALVLIAVVAAVRGLRAASRPESRPFSCTGRQYGAFYSRRSFIRLGAATVGAFVLAHTGADVAVDSWISSTRTERSDRIAGGWKGFGERFWFFVWAPFALLDGLVATHPVLRWGRRNFEATFVGLPMLWTLQRLGGASRPSEDRGSCWRPIRDDNTASGHTFMAAIPWLNLGRSVDPVWIRRAAWVMSWGTGWSRMNDRKHFVSQVLYGQAIADQAVAAVSARTDRGNAKAATVEVSF